MVTVGHELNTLCRIQTITQTQITCRTPTTHQDWSQTNQEIILTSKLIADSVCQKSPNCQFTYKTQSESMSLTDLSSNSVSSGAALTLTGERFDLGDINNLNNLQIVFTNTLTSEQTVVTPTSTSATSLVASVPSVQGGSYTVRVRLDPEGQSNAQALQISTSFSPSAYEGSTQGGSIFLTGKGLPNKWPATLWGLTLKQSDGKSLDLEVITAEPQSLEIKVPKGVDGKSYQVILISPYQDKYIATFIQKTSRTPTISVTTTAFTVGTGDIVLQINSVTDATPSNLYLFNVLNPNNYEELTFTRSSNTLTASDLALKSGKYGLKVWYEGYGWALVNGQISVSPAADYTATSVTSSYAGGQFVVNSDSLSLQSVIRVGGFEGNVLSQQGGVTTFQVPPLITETVLSWYPELQQIQVIKPANILSDGGSEPESAFDSRHNTFYSSQNTQCFIGIDIGQGKVANPKGIKFFPYHKWAVVAQYLIGATIQASTDGVSYDNLFTVGSEVHNGWNSIHPETVNNYRYFRFKHTDESGCKIAEFEVKGIVYSNTAVTDPQTLDVVLDDGANQQTFTAGVTFDRSATPVVQSIDTKTGSIKGGYDITLSGQNLGNLMILIDDIPCTVNANSATSVTCTVGHRPNFPTQNTFEVSLNGNKAVIQERFYYVLKWSDPDTWGTDPKPKEGDLVAVPAGMVLYVDQSTPQLEGILVEGGTIIFADELGSIEVHAGFILVNRGEFIAGTKASPYQSNLKFVMYGSYYGKQLPMFGNKFIGCFECKFSMWGKERPVTWTDLKTTILPGQNSLQVMDSDIDWQVGEKIVIASSSFDHNQAEELTISAVSGTVITVEQTFQFKHFSGVQTYDSTDLAMRAEVGLLSRNIKMMGDSTSEAGIYGSHLMMAGHASNGMVAHIGYSEFTNCGQPRIVGRYCIHFHMNGDVVDSEVTGNAVHHSHARILTIHAIHYLRVKHNVGYRIKGHNFFVQDGVQTHNILEHNLVIGSLQTFNMMQTDTSVASFWITNPLNDLINNRAAGGDFYAFWYEIKPHPDGPSATLDICPTGNPLGASRDNIAHSYLRFGLRIFKYAARTIPCAPIRNDALDDPWSENPSVQSVFSNYVTYKIGEAGLLAEQTGNMIFQNFTIAESKHSGIQFYRTNLTKEPVIARDMTIIGVTATNAPTDLGELSGARGAIGPRTSGWRMQNIRFYNFKSDMTVLETCSKCDNSLLYSNRAIEYFVSQISFTNISGSYLFQNGLKRSIVYDQDGTFTQPFDGITRPSSTIVPKYKHLLDQPACVQGTTPSQWDNALVCDETAIVRGITITNAIPLNTFKNIGLKVEKIGDLEDALIPEDSVGYSEFKSLFGSMEPKDKKFAWSMPYIAGSTYNLWWLTGLDFTHIAIQPSQLYQTTDPAVLFRFNYTEQRQLYEIGDLVQGSYLNERTISNTIDDIDAASCGLGDYFNNVDNRTFSLCISGKNKAADFQYLDVNGIKCRYLCPSPTGQFVKENFVREWTNATQWPGGVMPQPGDNVSIHGNWTIKMNIDPVEMQFFYIDGDVIIPEDVSVNIVAKSIWIRAGSLKAGNSTHPHTGTVNIEIKGNKNDVGYVINPEIAGTKLFVVHGLLQLYGSAPSTTWTKLKSTASAGDTSIEVLSSSGWAVGDELVLAPSYSQAKQHEKVYITSISGNTITLSSALQYSHYGASGVTIDNDYGTLDARTGVGHITRNIKIFSGDDSGWGFRMIVNSYIDAKIIYEENDAGEVIQTQVQVQRYGRVHLDGVQFIQGGQYDTEYSAVNLLRVMNDDKSTIQRSSFQDCKSYCLDIEQSNRVDVLNNVFYKGRIHHTRALQILNFNFKNNLMIAAIKRPTTDAKDLIACYASWQKVDATVSVQNNLCQGSDLHGFALGFSSCDDDFYPYSGNTVGSASVGFIFNNVQGTCMRATGLRAYACRIGQISSPPTTESIQFDNFIIADSGRAVSLRFGKEGDDRTAIFKDSFITAISRPSCPECYGEGKIDCSSNFAVRMLAVTVNGQSMPDKFGMGFDVICKQEAYDSKAMLNNVTFENYKLSYDASLPDCSNNVVFKSHPIASDITGSHNLRDTVCTNCELEALAKFDPPNPKDLGWDGGCGSILCTGKNNYLIHDYTGGFLPTKGILIANNSEIGDNSENCTFIPEMNGHYCEREDFGVLEYESIAPDFNTRIMWPVYLQYEGGLWNTTTNGWREWQWEGNEPLNKRLGRFVSIVELSQTYNMTFESEPPIDMRLQFQARSLEGDNNQYIIVKLHYPRPNSIRVQNNGVTVKPITLRDVQVHQQSLDPAVCGSNVFFYENYTVHFVVTGDRACQVRVSLTNSIQLTARFQMDINDFYSASDLETKFRDRVCAALGINDYSRVKIVGVFSGSVRIVMMLQQPASPVDSATSHDNQAAANDMASLQESLIALLDNGTLSSALEADGFGTLLQATTVRFDHPVSSTYQPTVIEEQEQDQEDVSQTNLGLIIGIVIGTITVMATTFGIVVYMIRKRARITQLQQIDSEQHKIGMFNDNQPSSVYNFAQKH